MAGGKFAQSCGRSPDDVTITDLINTVAGINMTVSNAFHHQHSRNYKLPFYAPSVLREHAVTLYGYEVSYQSGHGGLLNSSPTEELVAAEDFLQ